MKFNLDNDLVFFDIEATGLNVIRDRIIQIALIKNHKDGSPPTELELLVNPAMPISEEAYKVHGISAEMVSNKPTFPQVADQINQFIGKADLSGYNLIRFDIPMLMEEFHRAGIEFSMVNRKVVDVQHIFYKMQPRTLRAAYKYYCQKEIENAHDAMADAKATAEVLEGQLQMYEGVDWIDGDGFTHKSPITNDISSLAEFLHDPRMVDVTQRLKYNSEGEIIFNFGKYNGEKVLDVILRDKQYYKWIQEKDFSVQVKQTLKQILTEHEQRRQSN